MRPEQVAVSKVLALPRCKVPTLLGYLLALAILLGGGYAALDWLTSPDDTISYQRPNDKLSAETRNSAAPKRAANAAGGSAVRQPPEALLDKSSNADTAKSKPVQDEPKAKDPVHDEPKAKDTNSEVANAHTDDIPAGGCMPIGLTAQGELVFPLQCRKLIEGERGSSSPPLPATAPPSIAQRQGADEESQKGKASVHDDDEVKSAIDEGVTGDRSNERMASNDRAPKDSVEQGQEKKWTGGGPVA
jgi:hypothetical protein